MGGREGGRKRGIKEGLNMYNTQLLQLESSIKNPQLPWMVHVHVHVCVNVFQLPTEPPITCTCTCRLDQNLIIQQYRFTNGVLSIRMCVRTFSQMSVRAPARTL